MKHTHLVASGVLTALLLGGSLQDGFAQRRMNKQFLPYSKVGLGVGTSHYYGDLAGYRKVIRSTYIMPRWNASLAYTRQFTPNFAARASFTWARIAGDDYTFNKNNIDNGAVQFVRNLHFRNDLKEFALTGIYQVFGDGRTANLRTKWSPYLFAGLALLAHSPEARTPVGGGTNPDAEGQQWVKLQPLGTEGQGQPGYPKPYSLVTLAIPVGVGVRYKFNDNFDIAAEIGYRYTPTDYLDDVGGPYPDPSILQNQVARDMSDRRLEPIAARKNRDRSAELAQALAAGGNPPDVPRGVKGMLQDSYLLTSIQIHYIIPGRIKCPPVK
ncbi:hypothetical protein GCM10023189_29200 [Nibrella saemangeumensis]|uniref:DUF6089 domain-containing protein n=1 Tax=Nibrella saemangeumensis TaxID=1084526 RepID=A0ABP8N1Y9_9BACT